MDSIRRNGPKENLTNRDVVSGCRYVVECLGGELRGSHMETFDLVQCNRRLAASDRTDSRTDRPRFIVLVAQWLTSLQICGERVQTQLSAEVDHGNA